MSEQEGLEVEAGDKKLKIWGNQVIQVLQLVALVAVVMMLIKHDSEAAKSDGQIVEALKEQTKVQQQQLNAQREQNCLARLSPEQKKQQDQIDFCRALGKGQ